MCSSEAQLVHVHFVISEKRSNAMQGEYFEYSPFCHALVSAFYISFYALCMSYVVLVVSRENGERGKNFMISKNDMYSNERFNWTDMVITLFSNEPGVAQAILTEMRFENADARRMRWALFCFNALCIVAGITLTTVTLYITKSPIALTLLSIIIPPAYNIQTKFSNRLLPRNAQDIELAAKAIEVLAKYKGNVKNEHI